MGQEPHRVRHGVVAVLGLGITVVIGSAVFHYGFGHTVESAVSVTVLTVACAFVTVYLTRRFRR